MDFQTLYDLLVSDIDYEPIVSFLRTHLNQEQTILDAGCGSGVILVPLVSKGYHVTGIDIDEKLLGITKEKLQSESLVAPLYVHDLKKALGHRFDQIIMMNDVINYFKGCKQVLYNLKKALTKQGKLIFDCYKYDYLKQMHGYIEIEDTPVPYTWTINVTNETIHHQIETKEVFKLKQYVKPLTYYLDILSDLGFETVVTDGPDERKHYIIASL